MSLARRASSGDNSSGGPIYKKAAEFESRRQLRVAWRKKDSEPEEVLTVEPGEAVKGRIVGQNKGGAVLLVDGYRAFCPYTKFPVEELARLDQLMGLELGFIIISEVDEDAVGSRALFVQKFGAEPHSRPKRKSKRRRKRNNRRRKAVK